MGIAPRRRAALPPPARPPVVAVIGSTGTGKSQLAVELAEHAAATGLAAEAISADSMQTYRGLDVITNKADAAETRGVPHHLMSFLPVGDEYDITQFVADAQRLISELHAAHALPIIVGGTTYYVQHLLFPGRLVSQVPAADAASAAARAAAAARVAALPPAQRAQWDALGAGHRPEDVQPAELWALLHAVDPASASRWHYNDFRKVYRSLRILYDTGVPQSAWLHAQDVEDSARVARDAPRRLLFWVYSARDVLNARLDARIGRMIERGLLSEIRELRAMANERPVAADYTRGIFQAIGTSPAALLTQATRSLTRI